MHSMQIIILQWLLAILAAAATGAVVAFTPYIKRLLDKHLRVKQAQIANQVVDALGRFAMTVVEALDQTVVGDAKASGSFNAALATTVKHDAVTAVIHQGGALVKLAHDLLPDAEALVGCLVEQAVSRRQER